MYCALTDLAVTEYMVKAALQYYTVPQYCVWIPAEPCIL